MRPMLALILAMSILLPSLVYFSGVSWRRDQLRRDAKQTILLGFPAEALFRIAIPIDGSTPNSFAWIKEGEFRFQGMMYDVVTQTQTADSIILIAWADHHEAAFESGLNHLMASMFGTDPVHRHLQLSFAQFLKQLYPPGTCHTLPQCVEWITALPLDHTGSLSHQITIHPPTPPPQLFG